MNRTFIMLNCLAFIAAALLFTQKSIAQKLPNTQTISVLASKDIRIDGKANEWTHYEAYNHALDCYYIMSNDTENLYLTIQATYHGAIQKIAAGGITLTIKNIDKKNDAPPVAITYPLVPDAYSAGISYKLRNNETFTDKQLLELNTQMSGHIKEIPLTGAKGIADSSVSIYNDLGIKAAGLINHEKVYTSELAVPLKYLEQVINASGKFAYRIQLNGLDTSGKGGFIVIGGRPSDPSAVAVNTDSQSYMTSPTYLQSSYTLAK